MLRGVGVGAAAGAVLVALSLCSCAAVYPELRTPLRDAADGADLDPPPPSDLWDIRFVQAHVPRTAAQGRPWDEGNLPDPYARLYLDGQRLIETPVVPDTLKPVWPSPPHNNYVVPKGGMSRVEIWDGDTVHDSPICVKSIGDLRAEASFGEVEVVCDNGTRIWLAVKPARAKLGLGFLYELRANSVFVSRVLRYSPAARKEVRVGDELVLVQGKPVVGMDEAEIRSELNAGARNGLKLLLRGPDGAVREVKLAEGPIYLTPEESKILELSVGP